MPDKMQQKQLHVFLNQGCLFRTDRISIKDWNLIGLHPQTKVSQIEDVRNIMTPAVTRTLPEGWQNLNSDDKIAKWISDRKKESKFYAIQITETSATIGFLFLYFDNDALERYELRLGYLISESNWGKGIGSELIQGLVEWCRQISIISSLSGGVAKDNIGSIKVLEKNGFSKSDAELTEGMYLYKIDFEKKKQSWV